MPCPGRDPQTGCCPQGNTDHRPCLGGESACEYLAQEEAKRLAAEAEAQAPFVLVAESGLTPEEAAELRQIREAGADHD